MIEVHAEAETLSRRYPLQNMVDEMGKAGRNETRNRGTLTGCSVSGKLAQAERAN